MLLVVVGLVRGFLVATLVGLVVVCVVIVAEIWGVALLASILTNILVEAEITVRLLRFVILLQLLN